MCFFPGKRVEVGEYLEIVPTVEDIVCAIWEGGLVMFNAQALPLVKTLGDPPSVCRLTSC